MKHLTSSSGQKHLNGAVHAFDAIVVVRGISYSPSSDIKAAVFRISTAIDRVFKMQRPTTKQLIWHHGPILSLLLSWIDATTSELRTSLTAISITAALDLTSGPKPSPHGHLNTPSDLKRLESYAKRLSIPVLFVDPISQLLVYEYLATYMYYWAYYIHDLFPASLVASHFHPSLDALVTFSFRLHGASTSTYGTDLVRKVKEHMTAPLARRWAKACIDPASYTKEKCRAAAGDAKIHHAVQLADAPFAALTTNAACPVPAFSRLPLCPSRVTPDTYFAAPVSFHLATSRMRASSVAPFHILLPREGQDVEKVTASVQGTMMAVLNALRAGKGIGKEGKGFGEEEKKVWKEVVKACEWALGGCEGKMPEGVEGKVAYVRKKLKEGVCSYLAGVVERKDAGGVGQGVGAQWKGEWKDGWSSGGGYGRVGGGGGGRVWEVGETEGGWASGAATVGSPWD